MDKLSHICETGEAFPHAWLTSILMAMIIVFTAIPASSAPLGTGFTYQGRLDSNGLPINGVVNLRFSLWDAAGTGSPPSGGNQVGTTQPVQNVAVANGVFVVLLNDAGQFGANAFDGQARFLEIQVCSDPTCTTVTTLSPRQPLTAVPYALRALSPDGNSLDASDGNPVDALYVNSIGRVGIGTTAPQVAVHVFSTDSVSQRIECMGGVNSWSKIEFANLNGRWDVGTSRGYNGDQLYFFRQGQTTSALALQPDGTIYAPGTIRMGASGQYIPAGGEENLRILRGSIHLTGNILAGSGFTVSVAGDKTYTIHYNTPFSDAPTELVFSGDGTPYINTTSFPDRLEIRMIRPGTSEIILIGYNFMVIGPR